MFSSLESELATVRQEKESLTQQLLNTIKHKVALSQELDAWQVSLYAGLSFGNTFQVIQCTSKTFFFFLPSCCRRTCDW